ncbi:hypothetical protein K474DRAFT_623062 [Panus rudis PR-1116 ss-1]|nr:hypothetical protein K474DRAFT_623062 [Panus rudis PR-1116 ss-1]
MLTHFAKRICVGHHQRHHHYLPECAARIEAVDKNGSELQFHSLLCWDGRTTLSTCVLIPRNPDSMEGYRSCSLHHAIVIGHLYTSVLWPATVLFGLDSTVLHPLWISSCFYSPEAKSLGAIDRQDGEPQDSGEGLNTRRFLSKRSSRRTSKDRFGLPAVGLELTTCRNTVAEDDIFNFVTTPHRNPPIHWLHFVPPASYWNPTLKSSLEKTAGHVGWLCDWPDIPDRLFTSTNQSLLGSLVAIPT